MQDKSVIFSPHCDDAFLAMGGHIVLNPENVEVVDIFGTCAWTTSDEDFTAEELTEKNQAEERAVAKSAGVSLVLYEFPEALLRNYKKWNAKRLHASDSELADEIYETIRKHALKARQVYFPLAPGHHVDHVIVHNQMPRLFHELSRKDIKVYLYEDLPYSWYGDVDERLNTIRRKFTLESFELDISSNYTKKEQLLKMYKSQLGTDELKKVKEYGASLRKGIFSERVWQVLKK